MAKSPIDPPNPPYSNFLLSKPQISVGAKHSGRYLFAENTKLSTGMLRPTSVI